MRQPWQSMTVVQSSSPVGIVGSTNVPSPEVIRLFYIDQDRNIMCKEFNKTEDVDFKRL